MKLLPMAAYAVLLVASLWFLKHAPDSAWRIPVALLPVVPIAFIVFRGVPPTKEMDELERKIALEGATIAQRTTVVAALAYGFLQAVGLPALNGFYIGVFVVALSIVGRRVAQWKYR